MFVIVAEGKLAWVFRLLGWASLALPFDVRSAARSILRVRYGRFRPGRDVSGLRGSISRPVDRLVLGEIPPKVLLQFVEREALAQIVARTSEFGHSATQGPGELRQPLRPEDQQRDHENQD